MEITSKKDMIRLLHKFFLKSFLTSFVIMVFVAFFCIIMHDYQVDLISNIYPIEEDDFNSLAILLFGLWKILIIQFTLVPTLVFWCLGKCNCIEEKSEN